MKNRINQLVDSIFETLVKEYKLESGDVTPLQSRQVRDFKEMLFAFVIQNKREQ